MVKDPPKGLKRYIEWTLQGVQTGKIAYVMARRKLPEPVHGGKWTLDSKFNPAQEILHDPTMADIFVAAIVRGLGVVEVKNEKGQSVSLLDSRD